MSSLLDLLYPSKCALCAAFGPKAVCDICFSAFEAHPPAPRPGSEPIDYTACLFDYTGLAAKVVQRLKYERITSLGSWMAGLMLDGARERGLLDVDLIVPVPIHWTRTCLRGFNQAEMLCESMPSHLVSNRSLVRYRATKPQVGLTSDERSRNIEGAFRGVGALQALSVLLVDDVLTSGGTARECAKVLKESGAAQVGIFTFAGERRWRA